MIAKFPLTWGGAKNIAVVGIMAYCYLATKVGSSRWEKLVINGQMTANNGVSDIIQKGEVVLSYPASCGYKTREIYYILIYKVTNIRYYSES